MKSHYKQYEKNPTVLNLYKSLINEVMHNSRHDFADERLSANEIKDIKNTWLKKILEHSAVQPEKRKPTPKPKAPPKQKGIQKPKTEPKQKRKYTKRCKKNVIIENIEKIEKTEEIQETIEKPPTKINLAASNPQPFFTQLINMFPQAIVPLQLFLPSLAPRSVTVYVPLDSFKIVNYAAIMDVQTQNKIKDFSIERLTKHIQDIVDFEYEFDFHIQYQEDLKAQHENQINGI